MDDHFNSSDLEFEPALSKAATHRGEASIAMIIEQAASNRISSKKVVKQLQFGRGAPGTRAAQQLWVRRFNVFRTSTLGQSINTPFTGQDVIRFFDSIIGIIKSSSRAKPAPSRTVVINGFAVIASYGTFQYSKKSGYELTAQDGTRLQTWLDDASKAGRLTKGKWQKRVWLGFAIVSQMGNAWLAHHHKNGTWSWDVTIAKWMGIILIASLGARAGDVARSRLYTATEHMQYRHIELVLEGDELQFENLKARIVVEFSKGNKDMLNTETELFLRPLSDHRQRHMCPLTWLMVHALRHGLVRGSTIQEVLHHAFSAADSKVTWLYPKRPVLAAFTSIATRELDLDKAAGIDQALQSIKQMGIVSNILTRTYTHALRLGHARDTAHLPAADGAGFTTEQVRQSLGHSHSAMNAGVTELYVGSHTREIYNDRAANPFQTTWGAKFSEVSALESIKAPVTDQEVRRWQEVNEPNITDTDSQNARRRARQGVRHERQAIFFKTAQPERKSKTVDGMRGKGREALYQRSASEINTSNACNSTEIGVSNAPTEDTFEQGVNSNIDPRLLDQNALENMQIDVDDFNALENGIIANNTSPSTSNSQEESDTAMTHEFFNDLDVSTTTEITAEEFILKYSKINVVNKNYFAREWIHYGKGVSFDESIGKHAVRGNSRDEPTPLKHHCRKTAGCPFTSIRFDDLANHELHCSERYVTTTTARINSEKTIKCQSDGCSEMFSNDSQLTVHIRDRHTFKPKPCSEGCEPTKIYESEISYKRHMERKHSGRWPAACVFPGCTSEKLFPDVSKYSDHLIKTHQLTTTAERQPYFPKESAQKLKKVWEPSSCPLPGCPVKTKYREKYDLTLHIANKHGKDKKEAAELAAYGYVMKLASEVEPKRKRGKKATRSSEHDDDSEDEGGARKLGAVTKKKKPKV